MRVTFSEVEVRAYVPEAWPAPPLGSVEPMTEDWRDEPEEPEEPEEPPQQHPVQ